MRRARWKRKSASAGRSAPAQTSCRRRGMVGSPLRQSGTETPSPWGGLWPGEVWDTSSSSFRCRWPVVDESSSKEPTQQPLRVPRAARSEAERAERGAGQMRPCTPTTSAPSATGRQLQESQKSIACPKVRQNRSRHRYADPRQHRGANAPACAKKRSFLLDRARPVFFSTRWKRKWGVHPRWTSPPAGAETRWPPSRRPAFPAQRPLTDPPATAAWTCTAARPVPGTAPRWGWCGAGSPPPPAPGW